MAHDAQFDHDFLAHESARARLRLPVDQRLCTLALNRRVEPPAADLSLASPAAHYGVPQARAQDALDDTRVLAGSFRPSLSEAARLDVPLPLAPRPPRQDPRFAPKPPKSPCACRNRRRRRLRGRRGRSAHPRAGRRRSDRGAGHAGRRHQRTHPAPRRGLPPGPALVLPCRRPGLRPRPGDPRPRIRRRRGVSPAGHSDAEPRKGAARPRTRRRPGPWGSRPFSLRGQA